MDAEILPGKVKRDMQEHLACAVEKLAGVSAGTDGGILTRMDRKEKELITRTDELVGRVSRNVHENEEELKTETGIGRDEVPSWECDG